jgi:hypothetical protein
MTKIIFKSNIYILFFLLPLLAAAQKLDPAGEKFKNEIVKTYARPDAKQIVSLMHPKSAKCITAEPAYERYLMRAETTQIVPADAKVSVEPVAPDAKLPYSGFEFPVRPSHAVRMEYGRASMTSVAEKHIAKDGDKWYLVMPCPTPKGMARLKEMGLLK